MLKIITYILIIFSSIILLSVFLHGQDKPAAVNVCSENRQQLSFPWAGGMNSCQFSKIDINLDGTKDLIVFDRTGDRIMPFLVVHSGESFDYEYAPEYAGYFPQLYHWAIFADYDGDGKEDIFTYSPGYAGLKVYRNISQTHPEFRLEVYPYLTSFQGGGYVNILVTYADYPAIYDLDGDGDLDILTFYGLGSFVEKHRNMSVEKYGNRDSLDFMQTESCWGYFAESDESNLVTLDTCLRCGSMEAWGHGGMGAWRHGGMGAWKLGSMEAECIGRRAENYETQTANCQLPTASSPVRHTGSTFRLLDLNGDNLTDLLLGDVDYPNLVALYNGGNADTARMVSFDWQYPAGDQAVNLFSMPASFYDDFDFDGIKDLLVSPFDPNPLLSENFQSTWFYHNDGSDAQPLFNLMTTSFLQDRMIDLGSGAYPVFFDVDRDGLADLLVGNYGYHDTSYYDQFMNLHTEQTGQIAYLRNTGTAGNPSFTFMDRDFAGASELKMKGLVPAFGDLDGDNDADMLLGCEDGTVILYLNTANPGEPMNLVLSQLNYQGIDVGAFSAPQLFDLDRDNKAYLIIGEKGGNLNLYYNSGTLQQPSFSLVTDSLGKVNVTDYSASLDGYSVPCFFRDARDQTQLLVGSEQGVIFYFTGIDEINFTGAYQPSDTLAALIGIENLDTDRGYRSAPAIFDLNMNGCPELIAGNFSGGLEYFAGSGLPPVSGINDNSMTDPQVVFFQVPVAEKIEISVKDPDRWRITGVKIISADGRAISYDDYKNEIKITLNTNFFTGGLFIYQVKLKNMTTGKTCFNFYKALKLF